MDNLTRLRNECNLLKQRILELQNKEFQDNEKSIVKVQLDFLREKLTRVGRRLKNLAISKGIDDD